MYANSHEIEKNIVHTELLEIAVIVKNGYSTHFCGIANAKAIAKSSVWTEPKSASVWLSESFT